jgi:hypothetical protein
MELVEKSTFSSKAKELHAGVTHAQVLYLDALRSLPVPLPRLARRAARIHPTTLSDWRADPAFVELERTAMREAAELCIAEAAVSAIEGRDRPIYQMGKLVGYEKVHSEKLHIELLRAFASDKFARKEHNTFVQQTNKTIVLKTPEEIADAVRRLSPTFRPSSARPQLRPLLPGQPKP